ncbi:MAG TPA: GYD domain-containing protein [Blastocatellia bacterium]|nr:GYD domain-containing protein [Blastocatellia bacterium]
MAYFLLQGTYTPESWKSLVNKPVDRVEVVRKVIEKLGGKVEGAWFAFGDYDVVMIMQMPDNISAAAFSLAVAAGGAFKAHKTTPLMTMADGIEAMKKASGAGYQPPGS